MFPFLLGYLRSETRQGEAGTMTFKTKNKSAEIAECRSKKMFFSLKIMEENLVKNRD
jgi:hypothetical protein